jgi:acetyl-CoA synthase
LKERFLLNQVSVNLIFDVPRLQSLKPTISAYKEERKNAILRRTDADLPLLACTYCQRYSKNGFCLISVSRPPQCELSYDAVRASAVLTNSTEAFCVDKGELVHRQRGVYTGANKFARILSEGEIKEISLHSLRVNPPPVTAYAQNLAYYNEDVGAIFILSSDFGSTAPDGKSFFSLLKACVGKQVPGVMPLSDAYLLSRDFLSEEGGIGRVVWMPHALKERMGLSRIIHIATEHECTNMLTLKVFLRERGFRF